MDHDVFHNILRVTRLSDAFQDTRELVEAHNWLLENFQSFKRQNVVLIWDGRRGKLRNDPEFETAVKGVLPAVTEGWPEFISINNTSMLKVQFHRWKREGVSCPIQVFSDELEALEYSIKSSLSIAR